MRQQQIIECIPNFSEGRNLTTLTAITQAIQKVEGVKLLHRDQGDAANRTVFTFAGPPKEIIEAAYQAIKVASELIDMCKQQGAHPRIGATDVCPLVPIANITMEEVKEYALTLAKRVGEELAIPVYLYEHSATAAHKKNLAAIRSGEYEGLAAKMRDPKWQPDFGHRFNPQSGATVIGVRDFLIAYNANLNTDRVDIAKEIARTIRESGQMVKNEVGDRIRIPGRCKALKAIGWYIEEYGKAQVSMNLTNFKITGIHHAYEACKKAAKEYGATITGSELIGLIPLSALLAAGKFYIKKEEKAITEEESILIQTAIKHLGLAELSPFDPKERIIEYLL